MRSPWGRVVVAIVLAIVVVLGRGYTFVKSHGALQVYAVDVSDTARSPRVAPLGLTFFDDARTKLARATSDSATGSFYLVEPAEFACHALEAQATSDLDARRRWSRCFGHQSRWLMTWVPRAKFVDIDAPPCVLRKIPIEITQSSDAWWLWWLPLRHVGGDPYTYWRAEARFDRSKCVEAGAR